MHMMKYGKIDFVRSVARNPGYLIEVGHPVKALLRYAKR